MDAAAPEVLAPNKSRRCDLWKAGRDRTCGRTLFVDAGELTVSHGQPNSIGRRWGPHGFARAAELYS